VPIDEMSKTLFASARIRSEVLRCKSVCAITTLAVQGLSSVEVDLVWGVDPTSVDNKGNAEGDPIQPMQDVPFKFDEDFDFARLEDQKLVFSQLYDLFDPNTLAPIKPELVSILKDSPIEAFQKYCSPPEPLPPGTEAPDCGDLKETNLPVEDDFRESFLKWLAYGPGVVSLWPLLCVVPSHPISVSLAFQRNAKLQPVAILCLAMQTCTTELMLIASTCSFSQLQR
jgi:hypothetical protein